MAELKEKLRTDLTAAMKGRQTTVVATLRMALAAVTTEEVAGKVARELSDDEVLKVLSREVKKRNEAAEAFAGAGRKEQADAELAEAEVLKSYLRSWPMTSWPTSSRRRSPRSRPRRASSRGRSRWARS
jgi:uncharacterized protein YqeY